MRHNKTAPCIALLTTLSLLTANAPLAFAQDDVARMSVQELEVAAAEAYGEGDYKRAIQLMVRANQLQPHPNYLLNIAASYAKIGDCDNARLWAQNAIDDPELPKEAGATAQSIIEGCEQAATVDNGGGGVNTDPDKALDGSEGKGDGKTVDASPYGWRPITAYSLLGAGGLTTLMTVFYDLSVDSDIERLEELRRGPDRAEFDQLKSDIESGQTLVTVGYVSGVLLLAAGGGLLAWEYLDEGAAESPQPGPAASVGPWVAPSGGGVVLSGQW